MYIYSDPSKYIHVLHTVMHQHECTKVKLYNGFGHKSCWPLLGCYKYNKYCLCIKVNNNAQPETAWIQTPLKMKKTQVITKWVHIKVILEKRLGERLMILYWEIGGN